MSFYNLVKRTLRALEPRKKLKVCWCGHTEKDHSYIEYTGYACKECLKCDGSIRWTSVTYH